MVGGNSSRGTRSRESPLGYVQNLDSAEGGQIGTDGKVVAQLGRYRETAEGSRQELAPIAS